MKPSTSLFTRHSVETCAMRGNNLESFKMEDQSVCDGKSILFESAKYGLFRKLGSYELDLNSRGDGSFLRIELLQHVREKNRFRARVREPLLEVSHPTLSRDRVLLIEYAVLHDHLDSFSAQTEEEAFKYIIREVMKHVSGANEEVAG